MALVSSVIVQETWVSLETLYMKPIVSPEIEAYCAAHSSASSSLLAELYDYTTRNIPNAQMLVGPWEAAFLQTLVRISGARLVLEIGTFTGYSALAVAEALPADGKIITCEVDDKHAAIARTFFTRSDHAHKIELRFGPALKTLQTLPLEPAFDLVFVDADKENYLKYYEAVLPRLKNGGLILADNVLWSGRVLAPNAETDYAIVAFNAAVRADTRVRCVMVPIRDGVSVIQKAT
jgi:caffeoyl-CoA O-methyltransferase